MHDFKNFRISDGKILYKDVWRDQVNLLVYGPNRPYFKQKQKNNTKFGPTGFFLIYYFLLFEKKKEIKHSKLI